jgi:glycopeptide antibiotics resistance protein
MEQNHRKTILYFMLGLYVIALFYVTLFAWNYGASLGPVGPGGRNYNLIPFRSIYRIAVYSHDIIDPIRILLGNVILFIPFGFLFPLIFPKFRQYVKVTVLGFCTSVFIEAYQFLFTYRVSNIDDVILNSFGTFLGASLLFLLLWFKKRIIILQT